MNWTLDSIEGGRQGPGRCGPIVVEFHGQRSGQPDPARRVAKPVRRLASGLGETGPASQLGRCLWQEGSGRSSADQ